MKAYIGMIGAVICTALLLNGCTGKDQTKESSIEEVSVVSRTLTAYEKKALNEAIEIPLQNACTTLYECVCKGSVTKSSVAGKFSFSDSIPDRNTSPAQKIKAADLLTVRNAVEYFSLSEVYTDENIRQYGCMTANYTDAALIKGTVINISAFKELSEDYARLESMDMKLGDFIDSRLLLSK